MVELHLRHDAQQRHASLGVATWRKLRPRLRRRLRQRSGVGWLGGLQSICPCGWGFDMPTLRCCRPSAACQGLKRSVGPIRGARDGPFVSLGSPYGSTACPTARRRACSSGPGVRIAKNSVGRPWAECLPDRLQNIGLGGRHSTGNTGAARIRTVSISGGERNDGCLLARGPFVSLARHKASVPLRRSIGGPRQRASPPASGNS